MPHTVKKNHHNLHTSWISLRLCCVCITAEVTSSPQVCKCCSILSKPTSSNPDLSLPIGSATSSNPGLSLPIGSATSSTPAVPEATYMDAGYKLYTLSDGEEVVLMLSEDQKIYSDARSVCQQFQNGRLFVADTLEKMRLVFDVSE